MLNFRLPQDSPISKHFLEFEAKNKFEKLLIMIDSDLVGRLENATTLFKFWETNEPPKKEKGVQEEEQDKYHPKIRWEKEIEYCQIRLRMLRQEKESCLYSTFTYKGETEMYFLPWKVEIDALFKDS